MISCEITYTPKVKEKKKQFQIPIKGESQMVAIKKRFENISLRVNSNKYFLRVSLLWNGRIAPAVLIVHCTVSIC